jgi:predicted metalloprotease with PDZ domain
MTIPRRALVAAFALPLALSACSSNDKGGTAEKASAPAPAPTPAPAPAHTSAPKTTTPSTSPHTAGAPGTSVSRTGMKFRFGIMPGNYEDDQDGVEVGEVYEGTSAAAAGIKKGDRLMTWNGKKIESVENWMEHMAPHKAGDVVDVGVLRDGTVISIKVTLKPAG